MKSLLTHINIVRELSNVLFKRDNDRVLARAFLYYVLLRLCKLFQTKIEWRTLSDEHFKNVVKKLCIGHKEYIDRESCLLISAKDVTSVRESWIYVCSRVSMKKYKVQIVPFHYINKNIVFMSETMEHNLKSALQRTEFANNCFILPVRNNVVTFATETKVSLISNPCDTANQVVGALLENYFSNPRFLRKNDIFGVNIKEYIGDQLYLVGNSSVPVIYFKVKTMKCNSSKGNINNDGFYVLRGETSLIQEPNIQSYLPCKSSYTILEESLERLCTETKEYIIGKCPEGLSKPLECLESCIFPFVKQGVQLHVKPIFLVKGPQGSGRQMLIRITSEKFGLHLLNVDFAEVQTLTSAQTEAKLRIVLHNAEQCAPCILSLNNIEVFGKNSEGQKDERIISAFTSEVNAICNKRSKYPVIIIATSDESDIPAELNRMFVQTIHIDHLDQSKRADLISWLLKKRCLNHQVNLSKLAGMCSDFNFSDMSTLISHAVKMQRKRSEHSTDPVMLMQEDFDKAYEYMQSIYTDCKGAPRVPKVHWEDIGGLADLKHEIMRRIQLPLLNAFGFGQSGLLLYGPPGTGKTLLAKAVATEYQLHFLSVKGPEVLNMYVGQSEKNVRQVFERARAAAPCIIFFDELDSLAPNRGRSGDSGGVMDRVVSQLLAEMDGLDGSSSIFIIGATNRPDLIDPALLRPGRFDKMLYVGIHSDRTSQLSVLKALTRKFNLRENGLELEEVVNQLPKHSTGADLYGVCSGAWLNAARQVLSENTHDQNMSKKDRKLDSSITVGVQDFLRAVRDLVPSVSEAEAERYRRMQRELSSTS